MRYEWDEDKRETNRTNHGLDFLEAKDFTWKEALHKQDNRRDYGELRIVSTAPIHHRLCKLVWTPRGNTVRIISLRKANSREVKDYERDHAHYANT